MPAFVSVEKAIRMAEEAAQKQRVICWGPLIHNRQETDRLAKLGIKTATEDDPFAPGDGTEAVILRTHGVGPGKVKLLEEKGRQVIDATCPHVRKAQLMAREAKEKDTR